VDYWSGDSARWPQDKKLESLDTSFRKKTRAVLKALEERGFQPKIFYGWRSVSVQQKLYEKGWTKVRFSFHNAQKPDGTPNSYAADIIDKRWGWKKEAEMNGFWAALGKEAKNKGWFGVAIGKILKTSLIFRIARIASFHCFNNFSARSASSLKLWTLSP